MHPCCPAVPFPDSQLILPSFSLALLALFRSLSFSLHTSWALIAAAFFFLCLAWALIAADTVVVVAVVISIEKNNEIETLETRTELNIIQYQS
jgi:hypothetical protein